jgi:hypothetical protein
MIEVSTKPRMASIAGAVAYSNISRSKLYQIAAKHPALFRKLGARTLVDMNALDSFLNNLAHAQVKAPV